MKTTTFSILMEKIKIRGGVIVMGSLLWEDEKNCINSDKGTERRIWREENLTVSSSHHIELPVRYGRSSSSRKSTYTMVLSRDFLGKGGKGIVIPYKETLDFDCATTFKNQLQLLANVEGIKGGSEWGAIAIWINPNSREKILKTWNDVKNKAYGHHSSVSTRFTWSDGLLINDNYELIDVPIECGLDFLLCTYIQPKHKDIEKNNRLQYPTQDEIANEIFSSGYHTYFNENRKNGILTICDQDIELSLLNKYNERASLSHQ